MRVGLVASEFLYPPYPLLGVSQFIHTMAHGLADSGHEVTVVGSGLSSREYRDGKVRVCWHKFSRPRQVGWLVDRWRLCRWVERAGREGRLDVVETPDYMGFLPFRIKSCPVIVRLHLSETISARYSGARIAPHRRWVEERQLRKHGAWIAVSEFSSHLTTQELGIKPRLLSLSRYPVVVPPPEEVAGTLPSNFVLFAGAICSKKGVPELAMAMRSVLTRHPEVYLVLAGPDTTENGISAVASVKQIVGCEVEERVIHVGHVKRGVLMGLMEKAQLLVFPSKLETFGFVVAEAMAMGTPVVTTNAAAMPEYITDGVSGFLVEPGDIPAIEKRVERLLGDRELRSRMGTEGQKVISDRYSLRSCVDEAVAFYRTVMNSGGRNR